jgi:hypothetical protein
MDTGVSSWIVTPSFTAAGMLPAPFNEASYPFPHAF